MKLGKTRKDKVNLLMQKQCNYQTEPENKFSAAKTKRDYGRHCRNSTVCDKT